MQGVSSESLITDKVCSAKRGRFEEPCNSPEQVQVPAMRNSRLAKRDDCPEDLEGWQEMCGSETMRVSLANPLLKVRYHTAWAWSVVS